MTGPRWLALDADMFHKRFANDLLDRFGTAGIAVWIAFLCACKRHNPPGRVRMAGDLDGMIQLQLYGRDLRDAKGEPFTLTEFFDFCGRKKQTRRLAVQLSDSRRIADQRLLDVCATHWERWQDDSRIAAERERKRRWRAQNAVADASRTTGHVPSNVPSDNDNDNDISPYPTNVASRWTEQGAPPPAPPASNSRTNGTNPRARGANPRARQQEADRVPIREWAGEPLPEPGSFRPDVRAALPPRQPSKDRPQ